LERGTTLFRIHHVRRNPWWFSNTGSGRFDLTVKAGAPADSGTCYFGRESAGCFVEVFRRALISPEEVEVRRIAAFSLPSEVNLADCTATRSRVFGVTGEIHSGLDYALTQEWAAAFFRAGFDGIQYLLRHNPAQRSVGIALFGPSGSPASYPTLVSEPIGRDLLRVVARRFGVRVLPAF
jgi:RES domain-containing protein